MTDGWTIAELAQQTGLSEHSIRDHLAELKTAVQLQHGHLPPLTNEEEQSLRESIREHGVLTAIHIDENLDIIDGYNRSRLARFEKQEKTLRYIQHTGLTTDAKEDLAWTLNAARRQLTTAQRKKMVEHQLQKNPHKPDLHIARICGASRETVATLRRELAQQWDRLHAPPLSDDTGDQTNAVGALPLEPNPYTTIIHARGEVRTGLRERTRDLTPEQLAERARLRDIIDNDPGSEWATANPAKDVNLALLTCPYCQASPKLIQDSHGHYRLDR